MAIDVKLFHRTSYRYDQLVAMGPQVVRLRPAPHCRSEILSYSMRVEPEGQWVNWQQDPFSNYLARVVFPEEVDQFEVTIDLVVRMVAFNPFDFFLDEDAEFSPFKYSGEFIDDLRPYLKTELPGPLLKKWVDSVDRSKKRTNDFLVELNQRLQSEIDYLIRMEPGVQDPEETLKLGRGSCRDTSWLFVNILRHLGIAARFVSGYSIQLKADEKALDGPSGVAEDICDLHAWTEVFLPGAGWVGLDATSGLFCGEGHIPLAATPDPRSAAPIDGGFAAEGEVTDEFEHEMWIQRIHETPRVTYPYAPEQWEEIESLGHQIDEEMEEKDVRLTMGGEPTFVSIDDFESPEWTIEAVGLDKRDKSEDLLKRLFGHYGKGGFLHYGQGKWYPSESLPRWSYACIWRRDGQKIWQNPALLGDLRKDYGLNEVDARNFMNRLCEKLELDPQMAMDGLEDSWYYLWRERRLPTNVDPLNSKLEDEEERVRLAKVFEQGLKKVIGCALPIERGWVNGRYAWLTGPWFLRPETLFLIPGDSPMGLRLPLDSLPWQAPSDYRYLGESPVPADAPPLPDYEALANQYRRDGAENPSSGSGGDMSRSRFDPWEDYMRRHGGERSEGVPGTWQIPVHMRPRPELMQRPDTTPLDNTTAPWIVRTAMCVEVREGNLFVFMPPVPSVEDYIDLLAAIESTAGELDIPVIIEGYLPPLDSRLEHIKITPDPGVIEVNVQPSPTWKHLVEKTEFLYEAAKQSRLGANKFDQDGAHSGTGGGNHIVVGATSPLESPLLRNPKLLSSMISYWHQHPSLSYVFSGKFIGPTSQAPRIDEARNDSIYEMEIAFRELDHQLADGGKCKPWLVDRIFRHLLTDLTGNTHRAEFCIDKLYSPDSFTGRLGLLEMRGYEMPPHSQMSLTQHLLLRALINRFWDKPFEPKRLVRWGTQLHDRWMLPHFNFRDFDDVIHDLNQWGMPFKAEWFAPHFEFRFPKFGEAHFKGMKMEIRTALEPWLTLGEEATGVGNARYVDSSVERLQVKIEGLVADRYELHCNGYRVPLTPTGVEGEFVAGIRFRAWQPPSALHPTIEIDSPLSFDLVDSWNDTVIGGCRYHVTHPGGCGYDDFPVNALAAESRRLSRFEAIGHTPGAQAGIAREKISVEFPMTLDLREPKTLTAY
ncbi:MAG: transglutaminase family protein [Verrucomicrobiota bacterium]